MWSRKGVDLNGKGDEENLGGVEGEKTISGCTMWEKKSILNKSKKNYSIFIKQIF